MDRSDLKKLADLARLEINEAALDGAAQSITDVLELVSQLQAVNTDSIEPMAHPLDAVQRLRADAITEGDQREAFLALAPATEAGLYLVPKVIE